MPVAGAAPLLLDGHSQRAIAGALGVGRVTVQRDLAEVARTGHVPEPERVTGQDGKSYPATRAR